MSCKLTLTEREKPLIRPRRIMKNGMENRLSVLVSSQNDNLEYYETVDESVICNSNENHSLSIYSRICLLQGMLVIWNTIKILSD